MKCRKRRGSCSAVGGRKSQPSLRKKNQTRRNDGRFVNTGMLLPYKGHCFGSVGKARSSRCGGQYNFVSMGHALPDGRVIMLIKSTRSGRPQSNIVFSMDTAPYPNTCGTYSYR
jgi:acyl-CoA hydrolase